MTDFDLAINGGLIINSEGRTRANVGVRGGRIAVMSEAPLQARRTIDASNRWVLPGVIDPHVHFALKQGQGDGAIMTEDDYQNGPVAAAIGGVTMFIDFAIAPRTRPPEEFLRERIALADAGSCIDYSFHAGITDPDPAVLERFGHIIEMGIPSFKFFVTYRKWGFAVDLGFLLDAFQTIHGLNGVACIHAEQDEILEYLRTRYASQPDLIYHSRTRPDFSEEIAVYEVVTLARETGARLYVVHLTAGKALAVIRQAQAAGLPVRTETCPHYLAFTDEIYREPKGVLYTMTPPLRPPGNREALWEGLADGTISAVSSDHNAFGREVKERRPHWLEVPPGIAGSEMILTYLHSEGVAKGRITAERMVGLISAGPAALFGVPRKGAIRVGYDADLVLFDPHAVRVVHHEDLATPVGYTIFEGMEMRGWPTHTISRGEVIVENRKFVGSTGRGRFIERQIDPAPAWQG
ncbi:MAG: amidohydrolase family protein [Ardenticatenaceae bacterium]|nr:amidohydrolase family protein [Ardenticatenaceae bacterium]